MPKTEDELYQRFRALDIIWTTHRHPALRTVEESQRLRGDLPGGHCKNLFLKDKKDQLWLVLTLEDAPVDLKTLDKRIGSARLSFGKPELLREVLGVEPGAVTPFGLINDAGLRVSPVLDAAMMRLELLNYHPLHNEATTAIGATDLIRFVKSCGHQPRVLDVSGAG